jgi:hypothetical protein
VVKLRNFGHVGFVTNPSGNVLKAVVYLRIELYEEVSLRDITLEVISLCKFMHRGWE